MSKLTTKVFVLLGLISACVGQGVLQPNAQCDLTIPAIQNFNLERYLGVWYDIESIASSQQTGTCNTARYYQNSGIVYARNSQVVDRVLQTATGQVTVSADAAGTGRLLVTFTTGTTTSTVPYWVLATDYVTYALVYSCTNEGTARRVNSWKLGRQRFLPTEAVTQINNKIQDVGALRDAVNANPNVYMKREHTLEACTFTEEEGPCPSVTGTSEFNAIDFQGVWYETARYPLPNQAGKCNRANYTIIENGLVAVENRQVINEELKTISGVAVGLASRNGVLQVNLNTDTGVRSQELVVLATNNENFALLYTCENTGPNTRRVGSWQLRKTYAPLSAQHETIIRDAIINSNVLDLAQYYNTSQTPADCFYYPDLNPQQVTTIELPGACNDTITGVANFEAARLVGTWYEVARYPQPTQTGQCNQATYSLEANGVVNILNSQVVNEERKTITGTATTITGEPGVLQVTLQTGQNPLVPQRLYVLDTDYNNYALLYSCTNLPPTNGETKRAVSSWKLSKQQGGLTAQSETAINAKISTTQGLRQSYYLPTSQSNDACFYYPDLNPQQETRIELPGPCNNSISGYADFDAVLFAGTWYEVGRYPQPTQTGQCNRATYTLGANGVVNVLNRQVVNEELKTITGTATAVPGQPGVLNVTLLTDNGQVTQLLTVLDTDHVSYAVLYSCQNITGTNRRQVGSWKLSKLPGGLTPRAQASVNAVIRNTQGLDESYYLPTSQANDVCFYYPEWTTLPSTIDLPGPCNTSITGTNNFNAQAFVGTWHENARYPQPTQAGQCNRAQYTAGTGGIINVVNRQVTSQTLASITGSAAVVAGQTGVLQVTLNTGSGPTTQTLYVLETDNTNYALLYTCENIAENSRRVGSWQMVKQGGSLTAAGIAAINNRIAVTQGLSNNYYQQTNQTAAACFYYPEINVDNNVVIPGQCDTSIVGLNNFNMTRFANGTWYHVQRYDTVGNKSCISTLLTEEEDHVKVYSVEVIGGQEVNRTEGTARLVLPAQGQFSIDWTDSPVNSTITLMRTDYDSYAIAYNCETIGAERRVGVWLLSRSTAWPQSGVDALQALENVRDEFTQRPGYFKTIPHNSTCPEPRASSAFLFKSSIIMIFVCTLLQLLW